MTELLVFFRDNEVGRAVADDDGERFSFTYERSWLTHQNSFPISVRLPLSRQHWPAADAHYFFANLLPEGAAREAIANRLGVSVDNDVALLAAIGDDTAGAFRFVSPSLEQGTREPRKEPIAIPRNDLVAWSKGEPALLSYGESPPRLSLAGAQHKIAVIVDGDTDYCLAPFGQPSTHLLKFDAHRFPHLAANEFLTIRFAEKLGLNVVNLHLDDRTERPFLVIDRYDRMGIEDSSGKVQILRLHQEDFCQILGYRPTQKYEGEGGPTLQMVGRAIREHSAAPVADLLRLVRWAIFCAISGNADGHAKNLSLLFGPDGARLTPFYDLVCTRAFEGLAPEMAMSIGNTYNSDRLRLSSFHQLAKKLGIRPQRVEQELDQMLSRVEEAFTEASSDLESAVGFSPAAERVERTIQKRVRAIRNNLAQDRATE